MKFRFSKIIENYSDPNKRTSHCEQSDDITFIRMSKLFQKSMISYYSMVDPLLHQRRMKKIIEIFQSYFFKIIKKKIIEKTSMAKDIQNTIKSKGI